MGTVSLCTTRSEPKPFKVLVPNAIFLGHFSICACHPCAGAMLIFSVSFQFFRMIPEGNPIWSVGLCRSFVMGLEILQVQDLGTRSGQRARGPQPSLGQHFYHEVLTAVLQKVESVHHSHQGVQAGHTAQQTLAIVLLGRPAHGRQQNNTLALART